MKNIFQNNTNKKSCTSMTLLTMKLQLQSGVFIENVQQGQAHDGGGILHAFPQQRAILCEVHTLFQEASVRAHVVLFLQKA